MTEQLPKVRRTVYTVFFKRILDILISVTAIAVLSPLLLVLAILELIYQGWPVLFVQKRAGLHGRIFKIYKFRSMTNERDTYGNLLPEELRITKFGEIIRRLSLDELPELFCCITGDMSIVGPRPLLPEYLSLYTPRHMMRHEVRPGFACVPLKPVNSWTWNDQFENDIWYVEHCSLWIDIKMLFAIAREVVAGSEYRVSGTREGFTGTNLFTDAKGGEET